MKGGLSLFILIWGWQENSSDEGRTFIIYFNLGLAGELMKGGLSLFILIWGWQENS